MKFQSSDSGLETVSVRVTGRVQGVGYRASAVREAHRRKVTGWVRNEADGTVQALLQGTPDQIDHMLEWMRHGPPAARVTDLITESQDTGRRFDRFEQT